MSSGRDRSGVDDVVIDVDVKGGQRIKVTVGATTEGSRVGMAQRLTDINILVGAAIYVDGSLDNLIEFADGENLGVTEFSVFTVGPRQFDLGVVISAIEPAEQMMQVLPHLFGVRL